MTPGADIFTRRQTRLQHENLSQQLLVLLSVLASEESSRPCAFAGSINRDGLVDASSSLPERRLSMGNPVYQAGMSRLSIEAVKHRSMAGAQSNVFMSSMNLSTGEYPSLPFQTRRNRKWAKAPGMYINVYLARHLWESHYQDHTV
jgi:hypothetical protein